MKILNKFIPLSLLSIFLVLIFTIVRVSIFGIVEPEKHIYFEIVFLLLLAVVGELAVLYLKLPSVMILMVLGILVSPSALEKVWDFLNLSTAPPHILKFEEVIHVFAQLGAVILLFKIGMHNKIEGVFRKDNLLVAIAGVIVPFVVGYIYASISGGNFIYSMFLGAALTATSVGVTVALLKEYGLLNERFAQVIIGAAILDDIFGLLVLSFVINISTTSDLSPLLWTAVSVVIFLVGCILIGDYFIKYLDRENMDAKRFLMVLALMLMYAYIAEFIRLSAIVGAFLAGIILNSSRHLQEIENKTYGLELLFMPIFFISLGMLVDIDAFILYTIPIIIISVLAILSKLISCAAASLLAKLNLKESLAIGAGMIPRGEVALIVASLGLANNVISIVEYSIISAMALLTTFIAPSILNHILKN